MSSNGSQITGRLMMTQGQITGVSPLTLMQ